MQPDHKHLKHAMSVNYDRIPFHVFLTILLALSTAGHVLPNPLYDKGSLDEKTDRQETTDQIENDQWIILPDSVNPHRSPDFDAALSNQSVAHPQTVKGRIVHHDKTGDWIEFELNGEDVVLPRALVVRKTESAGDSAYSIIGSERFDRNRPVPRKYVPGDLVKLKQEWNFHVPDRSKRLRKEAARAIKAMLEEARTHGIHIRLFSAYRSWDRQRYLYLKQIKEKGLTQNSTTKPGLSEHQLGTTVDLCGLNPGSVASYDFDRTKEGAWLKVNASSFGFVRSYTGENQAETGIIPEPWHYRYLGRE
jgi:hypothetical protein